jgi:hypothetical protein
MVSSRQQLPTVATFKRLIAHLSAKVA